MIPQSNVDYFWNTLVNPRIGTPSHRADAYSWGGSFSPVDINQGTDCSGAVSAELEALMYGPAMVYPRQFWTGTFAGARPGDTGPFAGVDCTRDLVCIAAPTDAPGDAAMIIAIIQNPDPSSAHMICRVQGVDIECGGRSDNYHTSKSDPTCASVMNTGEFNQWFYLPGPIGNIQRGLDYAGGRIAGSTVAAAGFSFVCRYVTDGGSGLPAKLLIKSEADSLAAAGIGIVSNYESTGTDVVNGFNQGVSDAQAANANHLAAGGPPGRPIYFSIDFDEAESQDPAVQQYFRGVASVIGVTRTGAYGGYWPIKRLFDAGLITWGWQAEAWSTDPNHLGPDGPDGQYFDPRCQLLQRNNTGFVTVGGVQCDQNDAYAADYGQWNYVPGTNTNPNTPGVFMALTDQEQTDLHAWLGDLHGAAFNPIQSQSPFRRPGEGAVWTTKDLPHNDDGMIHPLYLEWAASKGDAESLAELEAIAALDPATNPDRAKDISLAKACLGGILAAPVTAGPLKAATQAPSVPVPVVPMTASTNAPAAPPKAMKTVSSGFHSVVTLLSGGLGAATWAFQHWGHDFTPGTATALSTGLVAFGALVNFLTEEETK